MVIWETWKTNDILDCLVFSLGFQLFVRNDVLVVSRQIGIESLFGFEIQFQQFDNKKEIKNVSKKGLHPQGEMPRQESHAPLICTLFLVLPKELTKLAVLPDYKRPGLLCLALPPRQKSGI